MNINLDKQFDEFYSRLDYYQLSPSAISLYMAILQIAKRKRQMDNLKLSNGILTNKSGLNVSSLQRARNELIQNGYIDYKKGSNQNDLSRYTIICLYEQANEQADEQPNAQPNAQAGELANAHNKLNYTKLFYYLININKGEGEKNFSDENRFIEFSQAKGIIRILKKLNIYVDNPDIFERENILAYNLVIQYAAVEELYFSPYRLYLRYLTEEVFITKYLKTMKYMKDGSSIEDKVAYFISCLQNYFCFEYEKKVIEYDSSGF